MPTTWQTKVRIKGHMHHIEELVGPPAPIYYLTICGNGQEGWAPYLMHPDGNATQVGPLFIPDIGETLNDLKAAARRHFGLGLRKSSNSHPF